MPLRPGVMPVTRNKAQRPGMMPVTRDKVQSPRMTRNSRLNSETWNDDGNL